MRVIARLGFGAPRQLKAEVLEHRAQGLETVLARAVMDAKQGGLRMLDQEVRCTNVGRQHALLNEAVRVIAHDRHDACDLAVLVEFHHRFRGIEVDRSALVSRGEQHAEHVVQHHQVRQQLLVNAVILVRAIERIGHLGVSQPRIRMEHGFHESITLDFTRLRDRHVADQRQPIHLRFQRTHLVRQGLGQHGNHPPREVHRIPAQPRLAVQRVAILDVVRNVGDGHQQAKTLALFFAVHRIVEVLCGLAINGDKRQ